MNRNDWVFVGMRLMGLYFLVSSVQSLAFQLPLTNAHDRNLWLFLPVVLQSLLGVVLFLGTPGIGRWLEDKDARVAGRARRGPRREPGRR